MNEEFVFQPERVAGYVFQLAAGLAFALAGLFGIYQASLASIGPAFLLALAPILAAAVGIPLLAYRFYGLRNARYLLEREGLHLRWGLRNEDIPIEYILWVYRPEDLQVTLPLPRLRWPGALVGVRRLPGAGKTGRRALSQTTGRSAVTGSHAELLPGGEVEFLAADARNLILVATPERVYALSPANPNAFLEAFQRCTEMGSLSPQPGRSVYPTFLLSRVWGSHIARSLTLAGGGVSLLLLTWVSLAIPGHEQVIFGLQPGFGLGAIPGGYAVPAVQLLLLPLLNLIFFGVDFFLGLFFFRKPESQPLAYLLWASSALTGVMFLAAALFILQVS
jgi:hypothetical protein